jgi:hypothetical protein
MKTALLLACALLMSASTSAWANEEGGTYQRQRMNGGHRGYHAGGYGGGFNGGNPWWGGGFYQPTVVGNWYQRPYPHHFDYFRGRYNGPPAPTPVDYPCVESPTPEVKPL